MGRQAIRRGHVVHEQPQNALQRGGRSPRVLHLRTRCVRQEGFRHLCPTCASIHGRHARTGHAQQPVRRDDATRSMHTGGPDRRRSTRRRSSSTGTSTDNTDIHQGARGGRPLPSRPRDDCPERGGHSSAFHRPHHGRAPPRRDRRGAQQPGHPIHPPNDSQDGQARLDQDGRSQHARCSTSRASRSRLRRHLDQVAHELSQQRQRPQRHAVRNAQVRGRRPARRSARRSATGAFVRTLHPYHGRAQSTPHRGDDR